ncbi:MAG: hypothetical protein PVSMB9_09570 [Candidatus Dormibacteria bacterium]
MQSGPVGICFRLGQRHRDTVRIGDHAANLPPDTEPDPRLEPHAHAHAHADPYAKPEAIAEPESYTLPSRRLGSL